jgi:TPR repeat protein
MRWFRLSAEQGNPQAQSNIGVLYANGWGVERNPAQARTWMEQAAAAGDAYAKRWLAEH